MSPAWKENEEVRSPFHPHPGGVEEDEGRQPSLYWEKENVPSLIGKGGRKKKKKKKEVSLEAMTSCGREGETVIFFNGEKKGETCSAETCPSLQFERTAIFLGGEEGEALSRLGKGQLYGREILPLPLPWGEGGGARDI